jgi:probable F420-dependent oxidoreductase
MATLNGVDVGAFGVYTFDFEHLHAAQMRDTIQELEELGWPSFWFPELLGREALTHAGFLLASTRRIRVLNAIALIWSRQARWTHTAALLLADAYPDRYALGLGFGGTDQPGTTPLTAMGAFLDELDAQAPIIPAPASPPPRFLAAYGPKMLALARDRTDGAMTYKVTPEHTVQARAVLGDDSFLAVEHAVLLERDSATARAIAREHLQPYLAGKFNVAKFRRLGYSEADLSDGGSDRFVDDFVFWGDVDAVAEKLRRYHEAGADHVAVQVIGVAPGASALPQWRLLAEALLR